MGLLRSSALRDAVAQWTDDGLITEETAEVLRRRYELHNATLWYLNTSVVLGIVAAILVSAGIVLLISENWHHLGIPMRMATGLVPWFAASVLTIWSTHRKADKLRNVWALLTTLLFGANIFLQAQIFHLGGYWPTAVFWWSIGSLGLAAATRSTPVVVLAQILAVVWIDSEHGYGNVSFNVPLITVLVWGATFLRTTRLTATGAIATTCWALNNMLYWFSTTTQFVPFNITFVTFLSLFLTACVLFTLQSRIAESYRTVMVNILIVLSLAMLLILSSNSLHYGGIEWGNAGAAAVLGVIAASVYVTLRKDLVGIGLGVTSATALVLCLFAHQTWEIPAKALLNIELFGFAVAVLWQGIRTRTKSFFMSGLTTICLLAVFRFIDYFDNYSVGAVVFVGAGVLLYAASIVWRRRYAAE